MVENNDLTRPGTDILLLRMLGRDSGGKRSARTRTIRCHTDQTPHPGTVVPRLRPRVRRSAAKRPLRDETAESQLAAAPLGAAAARGKRAYPSESSRRVAQCCWLRDGDALPVPARRAHARPAHLRVPRAHHVRNLVVGQADAVCGALHVALPIARVEGAEGAHDLGLVAAAARLDALVGEDEKLVCEPPAGRGVRVSAEGFGGGRLPGGECAPQPGCPVVNVRHSQAAQWYAAGAPERVALLSRRQRLADHIEQPATDTGADAERDDKAADEAARGDGGETSTRHVLAQCTYCAELVALAARYPAHTRGARIGCVLALVASRRSLVAFASRRTWSPRGQRGGYARPAGPPR
eukprot:2096606-Prymnesium_polylepis.2